MSNVFFTSDLHFNHKNLLSFRSEAQKRLFPTVAHMDDWIIEMWNKQVRKKNDIVWVLGDVAWKEEGLACLAQCNGRKKLILGNHDTLPIKQYWRYFESIYGVQKKYGVVMSHVPIHPLSMEFRWEYNLHGHVHHRELDKLYDDRYINVNIDITGCKFLSIDELRTRIKK